MGKGRLQGETTCFENPEWTGPATWFRGFGRWEIDERCRTFVKISKKTNYCGNNWDVHVFRKIYNYPALCQSIETLLFSPLSPRKMQNVWVTPQAAGKGPATFWSPSIPTVGCSTEGGLNKAIIPIEWSPPSTVKKMRPEYGLKVK